ncbi:MerR family transcriptional regulator [Curvivirga sp.]|uniref:MerR family transcriptional regulator n=1 Tax=Curvivirga sp. TaxID=2856848 RepID=UPI003B5D0093
MKIGELAKETGVSTHTLRYYEKIGLIDTAAKDASGHRNYGAFELDLINWVVCLKKSGMPLEKIKTYVAAFKTGDANNMREMLEAHLVKLHKQQADIEHYLDVTERKLASLKKSTTH